MSTNFPTGLDSYPTLVDNVDDVLAAHMNDRADAIEALEAKIGVDSSSDTDSVDYFLNHASGTFETHNHSGGSGGGAIQLNNLDNVSVTSPINGTIMQYNGSSWAKGISIVLTSVADGEILRYNSGNLRFENEALESTILDDFPSSLSGQAGKFLKVKDTEDGYELSYPTYAP